ncbi:CCA tRNA nucleotidyltransferase [Natronincola ferrireducens]|uniref:Poly(A) polymerase n=1 Tax=Natronincola ferrireducens TaxID=393762 RepID=A0A1G8WU29_9FIRM|nr:HDIG domain-containing metalloprotein [Natronincola ferrireducens]SDJ81858.1 poly(A) polymerase [Natronincola ferrireducens]
MNTAVSKILQLSKQLNIDVYLVGGAIRDLLLNRRIKDFDFTVFNGHKQLAHQVAKEMEGSFIELDPEGEIYRVVLKDGLVLDFSQIKGETIEEDLYQRDFTINAMAYSLKNPWPLVPDKILDPLQGREDIYKKLLRHVEENIFKEDPLRMLRAVRLMSQLNFDLHRTTRDLIRTESSRITAAAGERITEELFQILSERKTYHYFNLMDKQLNLLEKIFPAIREMKGIGECQYHVVDSWTHSIYTMKAVEGYIYAHGFFEDHIRQAYEEHTKEILAGDRSRLQLLKLGSIFHDVGKPSARKVDSKGRVRFKGHEITGAEIIKEYGNRLKLSVKEKKILYKYIALHMWPLVLYKKNDVSGKALYKMFNETGEETLDILLIALGDIVATRRILHPKEEMGMFKIHIEYIANNYLTRYRPIANITSIIKGREVMEVLDIPEGVTVGKVLEEIKKAIYFGEIPPTKEGAINYIKEIY